MTDVTWEGRIRRRASPWRSRAHVVRVDALRPLEQILERRLGHHAGRENSTTWLLTITDVTIDMMVERGAAGR